MNRLDAVRDSDRERRMALVFAVVAGLAVASIHWVGFVLGGALVGVLSPDLKRGVLAGLAFGVLGWLTFAALLAMGGNLGQYLAMGQILYVSVAVPVVGGTLGGLARGVV